MHEKPRQVMNHRTSGMRTFGEKTYGLVKSTVRRQGSCAKSLTQAEPGTGKGEEKGGEEPEGCD